MKAQQLFPAIIRKVIPARIQTGRSWVLRFALPGLLFASSLAACTLLIPQPPAMSSAPTPTIYWIFSQAGQNGSAQGTPAIPVASDLFQLPSTQPPPTLQATGSITPTAVSPTPAQDTLNPYLQITLTPTPDLSGGAVIGSATQVVVGISDLPTQTQASPPQPNQDRLAGESQFKLQTIYQDALTPGWEATNSWGVQYNLSSTDFVHQGKSAVAVTPQEDFAGLFFNRYPGNPDPILKDDVAGVAFWINAGTEQLFPGDLSITLIGSNQYPYYMKGDVSVEVDYKKQFFSETRLSLLDFHNSLQPDNWYQVILWLDDLPFDPAYKYVTGFYIKNDAGVRQTYYIDDLSLVMYAK